MSNQLDQVLAYLDRDGISEVVVGIGRPVMVRMNGTYQTVSGSAVTRAHIDRLFAGSPLDHVIDTAQAGQPFVLAVNGRRLRIELTSIGGDPTLRIELSKSASQPGIAATPARARADEPAPRPTPVPYTGRSPGTRTTPYNEAPTPTPTPAPVARPTETPLARPQAPYVETPLAPTRQAPYVETPLAPNRPAAPESPAHATAASEPGLINEPADAAALAPLVRAARQRSASDLHVSTGRSVLVRALGSLVPLDPQAAPLTASDVAAVLMPLLGPQRRRRIESHGYVDFAIDVPGGGRLRANVSRQRDGLHGAFRLAAARPQTLEELGLPPEIANVVGHHQGLVVIAGPSGHGKTTTLAALVDLVNSTKPHHIITIEDPVEIEHSRKQAVLSQREVGSHTKSFAAALKGSLREDPDVIVIGELRDRETVEIALTAAETGHLVLATMSTPSAAKTIDRLIDMFPPDDQPQVRVSLAGALRAVIAQRLLPSADKRTMVPAIELVTGVLPLVVLIRDDKMYQLPNLMQRGRAFGMIRLDESLLELARTGRITEATLLAAAENKKEVAAAVSGRTGQIRKERE